MPLIGKHNKLNTMAVLTLCNEIKIPQKEVLNSLKTFPGIMRRQQTRVDIQKNYINDAPVSIIEDFAHHPTSVAETILAVRQAYPGRKIHALFEPRSASSHRNLFHKKYSTSLARADHIYVCEVFSKKKTSPERLLNVKKLVEDIRTRKNKKLNIRTKTNKSNKRTKNSSLNMNIFYCDNPEKLLSLFIKYFRPDINGDVILIMSNGSFGGIYKKLDEFIESLKKTTDTAGVNK